MSATSTIHEFLRDAHVPYTVVPAPSVVDLERLLELTGGGSAAMSLNHERSRSGIPAVVS